MIDTTILVAAIGLVGVVVTALSLYVQARQRLAFDRETDRRRVEDEHRKEDQTRESKIVQMMVDDFESLREESGENTKEKRQLWDQLGKVQRDHFECERRCAELGRKIYDLEHEVADLRLKIARGTA